MISDGNRALTRNGADRLSSVPQNATTVTYTLAERRPGKENVVFRHHPLYRRLRRDRSLDPRQRRLYLRSACPHQDRQGYGLGNGDQQLRASRPSGSGRQVTDSNGDLVEATGYAAFGEQTNTTFRERPSRLYEFDKNTGRREIARRFVHEWHSRRFEQKATEVGV